MNKTRLLTERLVIYLSSISGKVLLILLTIGGFTSLCSFLMALLQINNNATLWFGTLMQNFSTELFGAIVTYLLIEKIIGESIRKNEEEKKRKIEQIASVIDLNDPIDQTTKQKVLDKMIVRNLLVGANLSRLSLERCQLQNADLTDSILKRCALTGANLQNARLTNSNLQNAEIRRANLRATILNYAILQEADFTEANLQDAQMLRSKLTKSVLIRAELHRANLQEADLSEANLSEAILEGTDLSNANLYKADLSQARLYNAKLVGTNLRDTKMSYLTTLPDGSRWTSNTNMNLMCNY